MSRPRSITDGKLSLGLDQSKQPRPSRVSMPFNDKPRFRLNRSPRPRVGSCPTYQDSVNDINLNVSTTDHMNQEPRPRPRVSISPPSATTGKSVSFLPTSQSSGHILSPTSEMNRDDINTGSRPAFEEERFNSRPSTLSRKRSLNPMPSSNEDPSNKSRRNCNDNEDMDNRPRPMPGSRLSDFSPQVETFKEAATHIRGMNTNGQTYRPIARTKCQDRLIALQDKLKNDQSVGRPSPTQQGNVRHEEEDRPIASRDTRPSLNAGASSTRPRGPTIVPILSPAQDLPLSIAGQNHGSKRSRPNEEDGFSLHKKNRTEFSEDNPRKNTSAQNRLKACLQRDTSATGPSQVSSHNALLPNTTMPSGSANWQPGSERPASEPHVTTRHFSRITVPRPTSVRAEVSSNWQSDSQHRTMPGIVSRDSELNLPSDRPTARRKSRIAAPKPSSVKSGDSDSKERSISEPLEWSASPPNIPWSDSRNNHNSTWHPGSKQHENNDTDGPPDRSLSDSHNFNHTWHPGFKRYENDVAGSPPDRSRSDSRYHMSSKRPENGPPERAQSDFLIHNDARHMVDTPCKFSENIISQPSDSRSDNQKLLIPTPCPRENNNAGKGGELLRDQLQSGVNTVDNNSEYDMEWEPSPLEHKTFMDDAKKIREQLSVEATLDGASSSPVQKDYHIVVDTNIFLSHLKFLEHLRDTHSEVLGNPKLVVSWIVLQELDGLKKDKFARGQKTNPVTQMQAIKAIKWIHNNFNSHPDRVQGDEDSGKNAVENIVTQLSADDNLIVTCCLMKKTGKNVMLLTNDVNLRNKACLMQTTSRSKDELEDELKSKTMRKLSLFYEAKLPVSQKQQTVLQLMKRSLTKALGQVFEKEMERVYCDKWLSVVKNQSPWSSYEIVTNFLTHWDKVFQHVYDEQIKAHLKTIQALLRSWKREAPSLEQLNHVIRLCLEMFSRMPLKESAAHVANCITDFGKYEKMCNTSAAPTTQASRLVQAVARSRTQSPRVCPSVDKAHTTLNPQALSEPLKSVSSVQARDYRESSATSWNAPILPNPRENSEVTYPTQSQAQRSFSATPMGYDEQRRTPTQSSATSWNAPILPNPRENSEVTYPTQNQAQRSFSAMPMGYHEQRKTPTQSSATSWNAPILPNPRENSEVTYPTQSQAQRSFSAMPMGYDEQRKTPTQSSATSWNAPISPNPRENSEVTYPTQSQAQRSFSAMPMGYDEQRKTPTQSSATSWNAPISPNPRENSEVTYPTQSQAQRSFSATPMGYDEQRKTPTQSNATSWNAPISPNPRENSEVTYPTQSQAQRSFSATPMGYDEQRRTPTQSSATSWNAPILPNPRENSEVTYPTQSQAQRSFASTLPMGYDEQQPVSPTTSENSNDAMDVYVDSIEEDYVDSIEEDYEVVVRFLKKIDRQLHGFCGYACRSLGLDHPICRDVELSLPGQRSSTQNLLSNLNQNEDLNRILVGSIENVLSVPTAALSKEHLLVAELHEAILAFDVDYVKDLVLTDNVAVLCQSEPGRQELEQAVQRYKEFQNCFVMLRTRLLKKPALGPM